MQVNTSLVALKSAVNIHWPETYSRHMLHVLRANRNKYKWIIALSARMEIEYLIGRTKEIV